MLHIQPLQALRKAVNCCIPISPGVIYGVIVRLKPVSGYAHYALKHLSAVSWE